MTAIGPGDWVECVKEASEIPGMMRGRIYCVGRLRTDAEACWACGDPAPGVLLAGFDFDGWAACSGCEVRPVYRADEKLIEGLKQPIHAAVRDLIGEPA